MPDTPHPPFVSSATQQPRTLCRWLDVNPQGGQLGRSQTYLTLPVFNVAVTYLGYSDIVLSYNFAGPNNFSLKAFPSIPINPNYSLAISYADRTGKVYRYFLWTSATSLFYFQPVFYTGQKIGKNCRFEIWSAGATASQAGALQFYTSVLGIQDYRWAVDSDLVLNGGAILDFDVDFNPAVDPVPVNPTDYWASTGIVSATVWPPGVGSGAFSYTGGGSGVVINNMGLPTAIEVIGPNALFTLSVATVQYNWYFVLQPSYGPSTSTQIAISDGAHFIDITFDDNGNVAPFTVQLSSGGNFASCASINYINGVWLSIVGTLATLTVYNSLGVQIGTCNIILPVTFNATEVFVNIANALYEVLHANDTYNFQNHTQANYGGFALPLVFPPNSPVPLNN